MPDNAQYTFAPWLRRGVAAEIDSADDLGAGTATTPLQRAQLPVSVQVQYVPTGGTAAVDAPPLTRGVDLIGPGDIVAFKPEAIIRSQPAASTADFEPNGLPYVEFYEEDFPWRYTPARAAKDPEPDAVNRKRKLRPWIALWVLREDEFELLPERSGRPRAIRLVAANVGRALPRHDETWAWAHVQISAAAAGDGTGAGIGDAIANAPDRSLARLVCPRRLVADVAYQAFIVPAFETGRLAGLGEDPSAVPAQRSSWISGGAPSTTRPYEYPVYHRWSFRTARGGDFESLVRALQAGPAGDQFGKRKLDIRSPGYGMDNVAGAPTTVELEGALQPPTMARTAFPTAPGTAFIDRLQGILDLTSRLAADGAVGVAHPFKVGSDGSYPDTVPDDPIVTPPIFGQRHAVVASLADTANQDALKWLREINLDPRYRAVAGIGVEIVQERQEELVERAWEQVGELDHANQRLREAELSVAVGESLFAKHLARGDSEAAVRLTAAAHNRVLASAGSGATTVRATVKTSRVPVAAQSAAFRRATRPQRKLVRRIAGTGDVSGLQRDLITHFDLTQNALTAAPAMAPPTVALKLTDVTSAVTLAGTEYQSEGVKPGHVFLEIVVEVLAAWLAIPKTLPQLTLVELRTRVNARIDVARTPSPSADTRAKMHVMAGEMVFVLAEGNTLFVQLPAARFDEHYGSGIAGKSYNGVTVTRVTTTPTDTAVMTSMADIDAFNTAIGTTAALVTQRMVPPTPAPPLGAVATLADRALAAVRPRTALRQRVANSLGGVSLPPPDEARPLRPVMAYPEFPDATFEDLRKHSQDYIIPNYGDLPVNTMTVLKPNQRFIEAFFAGLNDEMARELLWREYPTDQRGTYFRTFWDTRDHALRSGAAQGDIKRIHQWTGALGGQAERAGDFLVLVIRGEVLRRYPSTVVYAHKAAFEGATGNRRVLAPDTDSANLMFPTFRGQLDPDIALFGFPLGVDTARGKRSTSQPGWFFVLKERPGEVKFGLDEVPTTDPLPVLNSWNDLSWRHLTTSTSSPEHIRLSDSAPAVVASPPPLPAGEPDRPRTGIWAKSSADMAYILMQSPVLFARHAEELLPATP